MSLTKVSYSMINGAQVNVKDFGALGDNHNDDTNAIQAAINYCAANYGGIVYFPPGVYLVSAHNFVNSQGDIIGTTSIYMRSTVILEGNGWASTIKLKPSQYSVGTYFRLISCDNIVPISEAAIKNITIDGNSGNQVSITDGSNILFDCGYDILIENVNSIQSMGNGILLRGSSSVPMTNIRVLNCYVFIHSVIGIQCSQFSGLVISGNFVSETVNNCIDLYGDDGVPGGTSTGTNFVVSNNNVYPSSSNAGIFPETCRNGVISSNTINGGDTGIHCNTINDLPININIIGNTITGPRLGVWVSGPTNGIKINENSIYGFTGNGVLLSSSGSVDISRNFLIPATNTTLCISITGDTNASYNRTYDNTVHSNGITQSYLYSDTSSGYNNTIGGFKVMPYPIGPDLASTSFLLNSFRATSVGSSTSIGVPGNTSGIMIISVANTNGNVETQTLPYLNSGGTVAVGTAYGTATYGSSTITSYSTSSNTITVNLVNSSGNTVNAGFEYVNLN